MFIHRPLVAAIALALVSATALPATRAEKIAARVQKNEARLAKLLEGRTAGEPLTCIPGYAADKLEIIEGVALVYSSGETLYVAKPAQPEQLRRDDILVVERYSGQLCYSDVVRTIDRNGGFLTGVLFLGKFVPYKKS
jgi:hypothetical protein